ncbi:hypothetical protein Pryu01_01780 [Paraliobacillus ryukyuensis]|uniref:Uncharacterized protein n=1 Tax=Paraliobacillus ryukyuensis TaxID=200904 RepID=A0A366E7M2_9BACI|nr:hypothetical protein [Paraliobacillus ryukyuensis]RBO98297.1 hypothetical protein DES48_105148 [Paraliobacillus ryukyuensis]
MALVVGILFMIFSISVLIFEYKKLIKIADKRETRFYLLSMVVLIIFATLQVSNIFSLNIISGYSWVAKPIADPIERILSTFQTGGGD